MPTNKRATCMRSSAPDPIRPPRRADQDDRTGLGEAPDVRNGVDLRGRVHGDLASTVHFRQERWSRLEELGVSEVHGSRAGGTRDRDGVAVRTDRRWTGDVRAFLRRRRALDSLEPSKPLLSRQFVPARSGPADTLPSDRVLERDGGVREALCGLLGRGGGARGHAEWIMPVRHAAWRLHRPRHPEPLGPDVESARWGVTIALRSRLRGWFTVHR